MKSKKISNSVLTRTCMSLGVITCLSLSIVPGAFIAAAAPAAPAADERPEKLELIGVVRDFRERTVAGGHPDFERQPDHGFAHYAGNIDHRLSSEGKPVYIGGGFKVDRQWTDSAGRPISHHVANRHGRRGDIAGRRGASDDGGVQGPSSFDMWFRDVPSANMSKLLRLDLHLQSDGSYLFDDKLDPKYRELGGFFPVDDDLFGNPGGNPRHNFHFTYELHTAFTYNEGARQVFKFIGDDDVFVFIDGKLVIDIGGVHAAVEQYIELDRLDWLVDGKEYDLDFFFAERHRTQSNFRIQTNIELRSTNIPTVTASYD